VRLVTLAPELPGALDLIRALAARGVVVSAGHSLATLAEAAAGFDAGIRYGTHLFNAMPPLHHREPGLIGALLADERIAVGLIADGVHVHPALLPVLRQVVGRRLTLVSDAMAALGMAPGAYRLGDFTVTVADGTVRLADGTLAGSVVALDGALRRWLAATGCGLAEGVAAVSGGPAGLLGLPDRGALAVGYLADAVLLDTERRVAATVVAGEVVYQRRPGRQ
jgi:N-acetylglucosamine-6-phosphate deacetylase